MMRQGTKSSLARAHGKSLAASSCAHSRDDIVHTKAEYAHSVPWTLAEIQYRSELKPIPKLVWRLFATGTLLLCASLPLLPFFPMVVGICATVFGILCIGVLLVSGFWMIWFDDLPPFLFDVEFHNRP